MKEPRTDLERKALHGFDSLREKADEHSRLLIIIGAIGLLLSMLGIINPSLPDWWLLVPIMVVAAGIAGYFGAAKVYELIPDREGILLISFTTTDGSGGEIWEIYEDDWEEMDVEGSLYQWDESPRRVYECRSYNPDENWAIGNWRESKPASVLAEERTVEDAYGAIRELRQDLEPAVAEARELRRRYRGILRKLDQERIKARARQLDEATLDKGLDTTTITDAVDEHLPEELHPDAGGGEKERKQNGDTPHPEPDRVDIDLEDIEPLDIQEEPEL
jgi:hypothetical protein